MTIRRKATPIYTNNVTAEPDMFVDANKGQLHLKESAAEAIDQGKPLGSLVKDDFDGDMRDSSPDIGADEYVRP